MLLNGSPFHSPVPLLMAFSSQKAAQLNQQEDSRREPAGFEVPDRMGASSGAVGRLCLWFSWNSAEVLFTADSTIWHFRSCSVDNRDVGTGGYGEGGPELFGTAQTVGQMRSNKAGLLAEPCVHDPVCLCEFMATVREAGKKIKKPIERYCSTGLPEIIDLLNLQLKARISQVNQPDIIPCHLCLTRRWLISSSPAAMNKRLIKQKKRAKTPSKWFLPQAYLSTWKAPRCGHDLCRPSSPSCTSSWFELVG